jgi:hypothetical protein
MLKRGNKKAYEFSFAWFFTIIVGAFILFLAIYASTQFVETQRIEEEAKVGKTLGILLTPVETNLEDARVTTITTREETRIFNECDPEGDFGSQGIRAATYSRIGEEWLDLPSATSSFKNKYLFSNLQSEGKEEFYVFSKPLKLPFKIADLIMLWSDKESYCFFIPAGTNIEVSEEIEKLNLKEKNIVLKDSSIDSICNSQDLVVCLDSNSANCNVEVNTALKKVNHKTDTGDKTVYYVEGSEFEDRYSMMYAAIFSDPEVYKCQVERLGKRAAQLSSLYVEKTNYLTLQTTCLSGANLVNVLNTYGGVSASADAESSSSMSLWGDKAEEVENKNYKLLCQIF